MASQWQGMTASMRRRSLLKEEHLEKTVTRSAEGHQETGPLGSLCRQFQRRLPLRAVSLNLGTGPSWKRLETPEPEQQGLQAAARSAKSALGAMSQVTVTPLAICLQKCAILRKAPRI
ncbi:PICALM interacting mitotic regulator [Cricetulus griseus]